jgi:hypothetical protein
LGNDFPSGELDVWGSLDDKYARASGIRIRLSHESDELQDCEEKVTQRLRNDRECHALFLIAGLLQGFDVHFVDLKHGLPDLFGIAGRTVYHQFAQDRWDDLPGEAVFVFQPAAS